MAWRHVGTPRCHFAVMLRSAIPDQLQRRPTGATLFQRAFDLTVESVDVVEPADMTLSSLPILKGVDLTHA
jgi:hypothetical protein